MGRWGCRLALCMVWTAFILPVADGIRIVWRGGLDHRGRRGFSGLHHVGHHPLKIVQTGGGNDDGVALAADFFGDPQETASDVFLQGEDEKFPLDLNLHRFERVFLHVRPGRLLIIGLVAGLVVAGGLITG